MDMDYLMMNLKDLTITPDMVQAIAELDQFKGTWKVLGSIAPEQLQALRRIATIESIGSSTRIEGSLLTDREIEQLLSNLSTYSFRSRDEEEVVSYAKVMEVIFDSYDAIPLTENYIKQLHAMVLHYSSKDERHRGDYKKFANSVRAFDPDGSPLGIVFDTTSPFNTPREMEELVAWTNNAFDMKQLHPLLIIGIFIVVFLAIHPFQDGNGRLSRILTTLLLLKNGYTYVPYSSMEAIVEDNKENYYLALRRTQGTIASDKPDWQPWLMFFLRTLQKQKQRLEKKIEQDKIMRATLPSVSAMIIEYAHKRGRITIAELGRLMADVPRATIKSHLTSLVTGGYLNRHGKARGTWYTIT
jgi:Fic family protein